MTPATGGDLDKVQYLALKRTLERRPIALINLAVLVAAIGEGTLAWFLSGSTAWPVYLASQLLLATVFFQCFGLLHECGHGTAARSPWLNVVLGHLAGLGCFLPFFPWQHLHQAHHQWTGNLQRDPSLTSVRRWRADRRIPGLVRGSWRLWLPLPAVIQHLVFWGHPLRLARQPTTSRRVLVRCAISVAFLLGVYAVVAVVLGQHLAPGRWLPAVGLYLLAAELVNLPHHLGAPTTSARLPAWQQWRATRTCVYPSPLAWFCVLNFNLHIEHHTFPQLPWYHLPRARCLLRAQLGASYQEERGIVWSLVNRRRPLGEVIDEPHP